MEQLNLYATALVLGSWRGDSEKSFRGRKVFKRVLLVLIFREDCGWCGGLLESAQFGSVGGGILACVAKRASGAQDARTGVLAGPAEPMEGVPVGNARQGPPANRFKSPCGAHQDHATSTTKLLVNFKESTDSLTKLLDVERLFDVIVRADFESTFHVFLRSLPRNKNQRNALQVFVLF